MIKNEKQYKITKAAAKNFKSAIVHLESLSFGNNPSILQKAEMEGLKSQYDELNELLLEYEELSKSKNKIFYVNSLDELAQTLIKARIAQRLSQKELGELLGLKEQQIQRYEATDYKTASLEKLNEISRALKVIIDSKIVVQPDIKINNVFNKFINLGFSKDFIKNTLFPPELSDDIFEKDVTLNEYSSISHLSFLSRFFNTNFEELIADSSHLPLPSFSQSIQYKLSKKANRKKVNAQSYFAIILAQYVLKITKANVITNLELTPKTFRNNIIKEYGILNFESTLRYIWSLGIPVIPLRKLNSFHGACIRVNSKNVIILSQNTDLESRLLFNLIHEFRHATQKPTDADMVVIEELESETDWQNTDEESDANKFSGDVLLNDNAEYLVELVVQEAREKVQYLKSAVYKVAKKENVAPSSLANYLAYRLSLQDINWWGAAHNMQSEYKANWDLATEIMIQNINLHSIEEPVRKLILRALHYENYA